MIALHRAALVAPTASYEAEISKHCPDEATRYRLKRGESVCVNSARSISRIVVELSDRRTDSQIMSTGPAGLACIVLSLYLMKHPCSRMRATDLELLKACAEYATEHYINDGHDERFARGLMATHDEIRKWVTKRTAKDHQWKSRLPSTPPPYEETTAQPSNNFHAINPTKRKEYQSTIEQCQPQSQWMPPPPVPTASSQSPPQQPPIHRSYSFDNTNTNAYQPSDTLSTFSGNTDPYLKLPDDWYNVEELWNWMLFVDNEPMGEPGLGGHQLDSSGINGSNCNS